MTKAELIKALEPYRDDTEVRYFSPDFYTLKVISVELIEEEEGEYIFID